MVSQSESGAVQGDDDGMLPNRVADALAGQVVLVTGATGFMGKVLLEKMLRSCPGVTTVYLLVRDKKGVSASQRVLDLFTCPIFDKVKQQNPEVTKKVVGIPGDVSCPDLGLSEKDRALLCDNVSIVYHAAATIRFDEALKTAVLLNTRGTKLILELAKEMKKLKAFVHLSTSYCHLHEKVLYEKTYPPPADPHEIIECMETMDDAAACKVTKKILGEIPNSYAFTKALSEALVAEQIEKMPVIILRPSIVIPVWREPLPGWTDNINGPTGLLIGAGKGVIRTMHCNQEGYADYLPVDIAVNGVLVSTWDFLYNKSDRRVYHLTSSAEIQISWAEIIERGRRITQRVPLNNVVWYPGGSMKKSRLAHLICVFFFHFLPAIFIDTLIFLSGHKPIMLRVQRRINKGFEVFEYYANNQWDFNSDNAQVVRKLMNDRERREFKIDKEGLDIDSYFEDCIRAARLYILKEMPETLPAARRHMAIMYWVDVVTKTVFYGLLLWYLYSWTLNLTSFIKRNQGELGHLV
ncbi:putative fatty acyl-CoA reductase CG5065 [Bacillus rossius redtenbacheri]|uniref:putative fatty acyl-CoA reductase CG5065 n=1 Tax=Bacillus rossius redtenbacheri TaxID=93214 RepID=UPI002FDEECF1